jgi:hypothetical protein
MHGAILHTGDAGSYSLNSRRTTEGRQDTIYGPKCGGHGGMQIGTLG